MNSSKVVGVPWKGRNFRKAAQEAFRDTFYDPDYLATQFNGKSKSEAKSDNISKNFFREACQSGWSSVGKFLDTGRQSPRFGFDNAKTRKGLVEGYSGNPFSSDFDEVFVPDDKGLEESIDSPISFERYESASENQIYLGENSRSRGEVDLGEVFEDQVDDYAPQEQVDEGVSLSALVSKGLQNQEVEKVLVSEDLENISVSLGQYIWSDVEFETFRSYAENNKICYEDEEELIGLESEVAGVYIVDSGQTAEEYGLDYERVASSNLRRWTETSQNRYKELEAIQA